MTISSALFYLFNFWKKPRSEYNVQLAKQQTFFTVFVLTFAQKRSNYKWGGFFSIFDFLFKRFDENFLYYPKAIVA